MYLSASMLRGWVCLDDGKTGLETTRPLGGCLARDHDWDAKTLILEAEWSIYPALGV